MQGSPRPQHSPLQAGLLLPVHLPHISGDHSSGPGHCQTCGGHLSMCPGTRRNPFTQDKSCKLSNNGNSSVAIVIKTTQKNLG